VIAPVIDPLINREARINHVEVKWIELVSEFVGW